MVIFDNLLLVCTAPIQAFFFFNLFPILLLLQPSHQNLSLAVDYPTPETQCLLPDLHFSLSLPKQIWSFILIWADTPPTMHKHTHFWLTPGTALAFWIIFQVLLSFKALQINIHWHLFLLHHTASIRYQCFTSSPFLPMFFTQNWENNSSQKRPE